MTREEVVKIVKEKVEYIAKSRGEDVVVLDNDVDKHCPVGYTYMFPSNSLLINNKKIGDFNLLEEIKEVLPLIPSATFRINEKGQVSGCNREGQVFADQINEYIGDYEF